MIQYTFILTDTPDANQEQELLALAGTHFAQADRIRYLSLSNSLCITLSQEADVPQLVAFRQALTERGFILKSEPTSHVVEVAQPAPCISHDASDGLAPLPPKTPHRVPMSVFISSLCVVLVLAILATFAVMSEIHARNLLDWQEKQWETPGTNTPTDPDPTDPEPTDPDPEEDYDVGFELYDGLVVLQFLFDQYALEEIDDKALTAAVLKAYARGTGDLYASYYTKEELEALDADDRGEMQGIGVSVANDTVEINGMIYAVLNIISVFDGSPALAAGIHAGDLIYAVTNDEDEIYTVTEIGYDAALTSVRGPSGTTAKFTVLRNGENGYEAVPFEIERAETVVMSVSHRVLASDPTIGILKISQFDLTTPEQFHTAMDDLIARGCRSFIFDVRYNPGGNLESIKAVLSTMLEEGDVLISTVYKNGVSDVEHVEEVIQTRDGYEGCSVTKDDIGKYRGYSFAVLTNQYTASAAELFASDLRDHKLATLVGKTTYGKGCMQYNFDLSYFGVDGALRMTVAWYQPAGGENYHDVGITPDIEVEMDVDVIKKYSNIYLIPDEEDTQLMAAVQALK